MANLCIRKRFTSKGTVYEYRFEIVRIGGKRKWQSRSGFKTVTDARKAGMAAIRQYENYGHIVNDQISVSDFLDIWIENDCKIDLKPNTVSNYTKIVVNLIKPKLGSYRLKSLTREVLQAFIVEMYDNGYAINSLIALKGILTKSMNYAVDNHYLVCSPEVRLKIPKNRIPLIPTRSAPHHFIKKEIMDSIFERFPERSSSYIPLKLGYECGLRLEETFGLCWEDVDFENKVIYINRQIQWMEDKERTILDKLSSNGSAQCGNGYWYFFAPKYNSYRAIEISDELTEILYKEKVRQQKAEDYYSSYYQRYFADRALTFNAQMPIYPENANRISKSEIGIPIHLVCIREDGSFITPRTLLYTSSIIRKEITDEFDYHSLRHTHASMLAEVGVEQKYIQTRLGHSDVTTTIDDYEHTTDFMRNRGRMALNYLYKN